MLGRFQEKVMAELAMVYVWEDSWMTLPEMLTELGRQEWTHFGRLEGTPRGAKRKKDLMDHNLNEKQENEWAAMELYLVQQEYFVERKGNFVKKLNIPRDKKLICF